ncbi:hypothetical protein HFN_0599 [Helicobacter fennelliae MRY12-0050]|uniref:Uncharacterized protein n=1 Tax=Helicobacter fennelliae MRY12-0050 TaxID=1325130 RepID=T1CM49_9HELI|nr:hypothetical protein HFN_0599 [Helicobacter fennelliae MRY12-0050]
MLRMTKGYFVVKWHKMDSVDCHARINLARNDGLVLDYA